MAVKIKLKRMGKIRSPHYRIIIADARTKRDGRAIEQIGKYHPKQEPSLIEVDSERAQYWLGVGAQPTEPVMALLKVTGDWQKFKGLPGAEGTLRKAEPKADKNEKYNALLADVHKDVDTAEAKKRTAKKSVAKKTAKKAQTADDAKVEATSVDATADAASADDKPAKKAAAKKTATKKTAAKKAPAEKATAKKAADKPEGEPADKAESKAADKAESKAADKAESKPADKAESKPADKADAADAPAEES